MSDPNLFFSTPVWTSKLTNYKEVNEEMFNYIKQLNKNDKDGIVKSNLKGWHSKDFNLKETIPQKFIKLISPNINKVFKDMNWDMINQLTRITTNMWAIINKGGVIKLKTSSWY